MPSRPRPPPEEEFTEVFLKGSGPGGQKIVCMDCYSSFVITLNLITYIEQNVVRSAIEAHSHRSGPQSPRASIALPKSKAGQANAG